MNLKVIGIEPGSAVSLTLELYDKKSAKEKIRLLISNRLMDIIDIDNLPKDFSSGRLIDVSAVINNILPNGDRDTRNHNSIFKPRIKSAIGELTNYRVELSTTSLLKLRWTKKKWLAAIGSFVGVVTITIIKELPALISAFKNK